jgi:hypothetical protein
LEAIDSNFLDDDDDEAVTVEAEVVGVDPLLELPSVPVVVKYQCQHCKAIFSDKKIFVYHMINMHKGM